MRKKHYITLAVLALALVFGSIILSNTESAVIKRESKKTIRMINDGNIAELYDSTGLLYKDNYSSEDHIDYFRDTGHNVSEIRIESMVIEKEDKSYFVEIKVLDHDYISDLLFWFEKQPAKWEIKDIKARDINGNLMPRFFGSKEQEIAITAIDEFMEGVINREYNIAFQKISGVAGFEDVNELILYIEGNEDEAGTYIRDYEISKIETIHEEEDPIFTLRLNPEGEEEFELETLMDLQNEYKIDGMEFSYFKAPESGGENSIAFISQEEKLKGLELSMKFMEFVTEGDFASAYEFTNDGIKSASMEAFEKLIQSQLSSQGIALKDFKHQYLHVYAQEGSSAIRNIFEINVGGKDSATAFIDCSVMRSGEVSIADVLFIKSSLDYTFNHGEQREELVSKFDLEKEWAEIYKKANASLEQVASKSFGEVWESTNLNKTFSTAEKFSEYCKVSEESVGEITSRYKWFYSEFDGLRRSMFIYYYIYSEDAVEAPHMVAIVELGEDKDIKGIYFKRFLHQEGSI